MSASGNDQLRYYWNILLNIAIERQRSTCQMRLGFKKQIDIDIQFANSNAYVLIIGAPLRAYIACVTNRGVYSI